MTVSCELSFATLAVMSFGIAQLLTAEQGLSPQSCCQQCST